MRQLPKYPKMTGMAAVLLATFIALTVAEMPVPLNLTQFVNKRVLFVVAHPDDIEGLCGGLVSLLSRQGTEIGYLIATNGDKVGPLITSRTYSPGWNVL